RASPQLSHFGVPPPPRSTLFPYTTLFRSFTIAAGSSSVSFRSYDEAAGSYNLTLTNTGALTNPAPLSFTVDAAAPDRIALSGARSEEHTSELQSRGHLVCRLLLEKKNKTA